MSEFVRAFLSADINDFFPLGSMYIGRHAIFSLRSSVGVRGKGNGLFCFPLGNMREFNGAGSKLLDEEDEPAPVDDDDVCPLDFVGGAGTMGSGGRSASNSVIASGFVGCNLRTARRSGGMRMVG